MNGVPIRYEQNERDTLPVNYLEMSIWDEEKGKRTYYNSWITDKPIDADNAKHLLTAGGPGGR